MKKLFTLFLSLCIINGFAAKPKNQYVKIATPKGEVIIKLYNETPLHRDNFLKLTKHCIGFCIFRSRISALYHEGFNHPVK